MKRQLGLVKSILATASIAALAAFSATPASAFSLGSDWNYTIDSFKDGTDVGGKVGSTSNYEIYGMAMRNSGGRVSIAFNSNLGVGGSSFSGATNNNVTWGDIFFNFSGNNLETASGSSQLYGLHFATGNDAGVTATGVYKNVQGNSVMKDNAGYKTVGGYQSAVPGDKTSTGESGVVGYGDMSNSDAKTYLTGDSDGSNEVVNVIKTGTKVGDIAELGAAELLSLGSAFNSLGGSQVFGFSFAETLLPKGSMVVSALLECMNDAVIANVNIPTTTNSQATPEPLTMLAAGAAVGFGSMFKKQRGQSQKA